MRTQTRLCGNYSFESGANLKRNLVKNFRNHKLPFFTFIHSFFICIKLISLWRLKFGLNIFKISETKRFKQYFYISKEQACSK